MHYVYVLRSQRDAELYFGSTNDLRKRLRQHNTGQVFSTQRRTPFDLVYYEAYRAERDARHREQHLKLRANAFSQLKRRLTHSLQAP